MNLRSIAVVSLASLMAGVLVLVGVSCRSLNQTTDEVSPITLSDVSEKSGIRFQHHDGGTGKRLIMETVASGLALFDFDGDGLIDVYFLSGASHGEESASTRGRNTLYRNLGNWNFVDVTDQAGVGDAGFGLGVAIADYDNDGHPDIYVNNFGPNVLYRNNGDGTFTDIALSGGVQGGEEVGAGVAFLDIDNDGLLDLYVANYLHYSEAIPPNTTIRGVPSYNSPKVYPPASDRLFRNAGDGTFVDISQSSGIGETVGWGMGVVAADFNGNGRTDIFVANDVCENFLFINDGNGSFVESGLLSGVAYDLYGSPQGSMGVECFDFDNDGLQDLYQTSYQLQHAVLYRNRTNGQFEDVTLQTGAGEATFSQVTWGVGAPDFDNDGFRDLFIACGHLQDLVDQYDPTVTYRSKNVLLRNLGNGRFENISDIAGSGLQVQQSSRGAVFDDLDNDGLIDAVILNSRQSPTVLKNQSTGENHWIQVELVGVRCNRDAVGSKVTVISGDLRQSCEVHSGRGYQSHYGSRLHFGLAGHQQVDRIEIQWHGGTTQVIEDLAVNRQYRFVEPID
jgi:hypothetical protein